MTDIKDRGALDIVEPLLDRIDKLTEQLEQAKMNEYLNYLINRLTEKGFAIEIEITDIKSRIHVFRPGDEDDTAVWEGEDWREGVRSMHGLVDTTT